MNNLLNQYLLTKKEIKAYNKELKDKLMEDHDYYEFAEDLSASREVLRSRRDSLIAESVFMGSIASKIEAKRKELKVLKASIIGSVVVTDKESGETVQLSFNF